MVPNGTDKNSIMSSGSQTRKRSDRVAHLDMPPSRLERAAAVFRRKDFLLRFAICVSAALFMLLATRAWQPPFSFCRDAFVQRDVVARVTFSEPDDQQTSQEREKARRTVQCVYDNDIKPLLELREALKGQVFELIRAESFDDVTQEVWESFTTPPDSEGQPVSPAVLSSTREQDYLSFVEALKDDKDLEQFVKSISRAMSPFEEFGLLEKLKHNLEQGSHTDITVYIVREDKEILRVPVKRVRLAEASAELRRRLAEELDQAILVDPIYFWLEKNMPTTLAFNKDRTRVAKDEAADAVEDVMITYAAGVDELAQGGTWLVTTDIALLSREHSAWLEQRTVGDALYTAAAKLGMFMQLYTLCGVYAVRRHPRFVASFRQFVALQVCVVLVILGTWLLLDDWHAELVPLTVFAMIVAIAYPQELALMLGSAVGLAAIVILGFGLNQFIVVTSCISVTILLLRNVSSRTKLIYVGLMVGVVAMATTIGVNVALNAPVSPELLGVACKNLFYCFLAGLLMTGMLPFVEYVFDIQTDLSLWELGDVSHPLLQELVRRAPGTYNHSINVASIAEAAADAIGANGLLVRVGAYFHDIGKMLKPMYFVENQGSEGNRHEALVPAMSTLIIIAHVKDGADLARQHHLPQSIIDFILQHHGTTLVEYFYNRASEQSEEDPNTAKVDEGNYRYPGPKPQTREAAVLMLADAVESASRSLQEPGPARIESLVRNIAMQRLESGQFDDCHLTLRELHTIEQSLIKSLTAMYHGRVKYPNQQSA